MAIIFEFTRFGQDLSHSIWTPIQHTDPGIKLTLLSRTPESDPLLHIVDHMHGGPYNICTSDLTSLLKHNLSCSGKLLEKGLITEAVHNYVLTAQGVSTLEKAARLVSCLADRVGASSQLFQELVQALKEIDPFCGNIIDKLTSLHSTSQLYCVYIFVVLFASSLILNYLGSFNALRITSEEENKQGTCEY